MQLASGKLVGSLAGSVGIGTGTSALEDMMLVMVVGTVAVSVRRAFIFTSLFR